MSFPVLVKTEIPQEQFAYLSALARKHNTEVGPLVAELVRRSLPKIPEFPERAPRDETTRRQLSGEEIAQIKALHGQGLSDSAISRRLGMNNKTISKYREQLGLVKNARNGRPKKETAA